MKVSAILCAILACIALAFAARATASSEDGRPSRSEANAGQAPAPGQDASAKPESTQTREPARARARAGGDSTGSGSKGRDAAASSGGGSATSQRSGARGGVAQAGRSNADRLHSLLDAKVHGPLTRRPGRPAGTPSAAGGSAARGPRDAGPASQPKLAASNGVAPAAPRLTLVPKPTPVPSLTAAPRLAVSPKNAAIGGPHAPGVGRVGGPVVSRATHSATIDGTQLRHKS